MITHGLAQQHSTLQFLLMFAQFLHCCSCVLLTYSDPRLPEMVKSNYLAEKEKKKGKKNNVKYYSQT